MTAQSEVKEFLSKAGIHNEWIKAYRNKDNEAFFNNAFNKIVRLTGMDASKSILDAGCGSANHAIRLAAKGLNITAIDFSESVLEIARERVAALGLSAKIKLQQADLTALPFDDHSFDVAYCWGVLMHIADVETAIAELCRVVKPGGHIIISEANKGSVEALTRRNLFKLAGRKIYTEDNTNRGWENWYDKDNARFLVRISKISWLKNAFSKNQAQLVHRFSGQFTELYRSFNIPVIQKLIHGFNSFWFKLVRLPHLSFGNILIFKKVS
jgi:ubiquinone/menaquinone biosynthesis C-methylase UbiE